MAALLLLSPGFFLLMLTSESEEPGAPPEVAALVVGSLIAGPLLLLGYSGLALYVGGFCLALSRCAQWFKGEESPD